MMKNDGCTLITREQFLSVLKVDKNQQVHTFLNPGVNTLLGADWDYDSIINESNNPNVEFEISGEASRSMGHGVVLWIYKDTPLFCAHDETKLKELELRLKDESIKDWTRF